MISIDFIRATSYLVLFTAINIVSKKPIVSEKGKADVSLTSYGYRIKGVFATIESIARGNELPRSIMLWIDEKERHLTAIPSLQRLMNRGLEIRFCPDYGPHKKYYPYVQKKSLDLPLVTADDDVIYPRTWLSGLLNIYVRFPGNIHGYRMRRMALDGERIRDYRQWRLCSTDEASELNVATGVAGVLYPPEYLHFLKNQEGVFLNTCPRADDLWLHYIAVKNNFKYRQVCSRAIRALETPGSQRESLYSYNVKKDGNNIVLDTLYPDRIFPFWNSSP